MTLASESAATVAGAVAAAAMVEAGPSAIWQHLDVGAPMNVLLWISIGAAAGVWNKRIAHKGNLIGAFLMSFVLTLGVVVGIPQWSGYRWNSAGYQAAMGLLLAFTAQNWGPKAMGWISKLDIGELIQGLLAHWVKPRRDDDGRR